MNNQLLAPENRTSLLALLIACAMFLAVLSLFLPVVSVEFLGTWSITGMEAIFDGIADETGVTCLAICLAGSVLAGISAVAAYKKAKLLLIPLILVVLNCIMMVVGVGDDIDYVAFGFYLFEIMNLAALVMAIVALYLSSKNGGTVAAHMLVCAACGAKMEANAGFCASCGATAKKTDPKPVVVCPKCKATQDDGAVFCSTCGSSLRGRDVMPTTTPIPAPKPAPAPIPTPTPTKDKGDRKAICPRCGARQSSENSNCKYCGTPMR